MSYSRLRFGGGDVTMAIDGAYRPCDDTAPARRADDGQTVSNQLAGRPRLVNNREMAFRRAQAGGAAAYRRENGAKSRHHTAACRHRQRRADCGSVECELDTFCESKSLHFKIC